MTVGLLTIAAVTGLAFANGANDVSKGIATLAGSRRASYRQALAWGTLWTALGAFAAIGIASGLVTSFTSALVVADVLAAPGFALAAVSGALGYAVHRLAARAVASERLHWGASAALSFARGVNDNPKIAALGVLAVATLGAEASAAFALAATAMTAGSFLAGLRVSRTLGERVVRMDVDTGAASAVVAAGLVLAASVYTLPVSTTHVSTGAIVGAGVRQGGDAVRWGMVGTLVAAWVVTLPAAVALGAAAQWVASGLG